MKCISLCFIWYLGRYCACWAWAERRVGNWHEIHCWVAVHLLPRNWDQSCTEHRMLHCLGSDMKAYLWVEIPRCINFFLSSQEHNLSLGSGLSLESTDPSAGSTVTFSQSELNECVIYTCGTHCGALLRHPTSGLQLAAVLDRQLAPVSFWSPNPREEKHLVYSHAPFPGAARIQGWADVGVGRSSPVLSLRTSLQGDPSSRVPCEINRHLWCDCTAAQLLSLPQSAVFVSTQVLMPRSFPNEPPAGNAPSLNRFSREPTLKQKFFPSTGLLFSFSCSLLLRDKLMFSF